MQFLNDPRGGASRWRLLSGNNRPLAMGRMGTRSPRDELAAVRRLVRDAEPTLRRDRDGSWRWELVADDGPEVRCPGAFARRIDARRSFRRFSEAVEQATVTAGPPLSREPGPLTARMGEPRR
ncbi:hypothetical protein [Kribbella italica]